MTEREVMELFRGRGLDTPICKIRVFHISNPDYTYEFVRQEENEVLVVDDRNEELNGRRNLKMFPANELVNVVVFREALLKSRETPLPQTE